jgi:hypothetical protein
LLEEVLCRLPGWLTVALAGGLTMSACGSTEDGVVRGVVTTDDGAPVAGCAVVPVSLSGTTVPETASVTAPEGSYGWTLSPGEYDMGVFCDPPQGEAHGVVVPAGETVLLDIRVPS